jgi:hypothetical protein
MKVAGVWDLECADWDRFRVGQLLAANGERFTSWDPDAFFDALIEREGVWYAHVGGRYDALWLLDMATRRGVPWSARMRGAGVLSARVGNVEVRDSYALLPMSLAKAAELGDAPKLALGLQCECETEGCEGFCVLRRELTPRERAKVEEYLSGDCDALASTLGALIDTAADHDIDLKLTVGGSAWSTARRWLDLPKCDHDIGRYRMLREGYYGGRTECFTPRARRGHRYDIHSSYPAALSRVALPVGAGRSVGGRLAMVAFESGQEGIFWCDVRVRRDEWIPPMPAREADRLLYPVGPFSGAWTAIELRHAVENGATITAMTRAHVWSESAPILAPFAERVWRYRDDAARAGRKSRAAWFKWLANSLTGKLAQRPEHGALAFKIGDPPDLDEGERVVFYSGAGAFTYQETSRVDACAHVQWSAYLTSEARVEVHRQLQHAISVLASPLYCDTDSVYAKRRLTRRIGDELGEWGYEGELHSFRCLAPKVYRYRDEHGADHIRGKGLSGLDLAGFNALARGRGWTVDRGVKGLRTAMRSKEGGLFQRNALTRALHPIPGWIGGREVDGASTRPTTVARYRARAKR